MATSPKRLFKVDARVLLSLGRESIKDQTTALIELVKNSYDADAENVEVEINFAGDSNTDFIRVSDDGCGMSSKDIDGKWLRIGYSEKRKEKISKKGRRETGEKGIGRLSADRLGSVLELRTAKPGASPVGIKVDWNQFDVDGAELESVPVQELGDPRPTLPRGKKPSEGGTEIIIRSLRQEWLDSEIRLLEDELSTLVPPAQVKSDFLLWLKTSHDGEFQQVGSAFTSIAELEFYGQFDTKGRLSYQVSARPLKSGQKRQTIKTGRIAWDQLLQTKSDLPYDIGRFSVSLAFYLRSNASLTEGLTLSQLREYLDTQGGVRIYRDGIRVKPYGDPNHPEGDWLGLSERKNRNPAGAARRDFRMAANQLVGAVEISRDVNPSLADSAAREGLIHGDAYASLKAAVFGCIGILESIYHDRFVRQKTPSEGVRPKLPEMVSEIKSELATLTRDLTSAERVVAEVGSSRLLRDSVHRLQQVTQKVQLAERGIDEIASQSTVYRGLATVGISAAVFGHETESALVQAKLSSTVATKALQKANPDIELSKSELAKLNQAISRVQVWGQFALARVKKDKRRRAKFDLSSAVSAVIDEMGPLFGSSSIQLNRKIESGIEIRAFVMDIEALILNLLTNAYHAASISKKNRQVIVALSLVGPKGDKAIRITVSDSGPGIPKEHFGQIWTPLFSTRVDQKGKPVGTGLGLTIVKSIADDLGASVTAKARGELGGAVFEVSIPV